MNATGTGIGRALQRAREGRGKTLEEASRETRIRTEYLQALERERFDRLLGDVYARGFLRSYSSYLGLDADRVLELYARSHGAPAPSLPAERPQSPSMAPNSDGHPLIHRRANWRLAAAVAAVAMALVAVVAVATRDSTVPEPAVPSPPSVVPDARPVFANLVTVVEVEARVVVDGETALEGTLARGEARSFEGEESIELWFASGDTVRLTVNGRSLGRPGAAGEPYSATFDPDDFRGSPSAGG